MKEERTFRAGKGGDGNDYGVVRLTGEANEKRRVRKKPCPTCPWRKDAEKGRFPADAFRSSASTAYDASLTTFSCHEAGREKIATCAGFVLANSAHNMALRIDHIKGRYDPGKVKNPEGVELFSDYREMAIANGVNPEDPRIAPCRGDNEDGMTVFERIRASGYKPEYDGEAILRKARDEDHDILMEKGKEDG